MGNSNSHLVHPAHHPKALKGFNGHSLKNAEEDLSKNKDFESMNADKLRMMPNIHTVASAPYLLDNINESAKDHHGSIETTMHHLKSDERDTANALYDNDIAEAHSIPILLKEDNIKSASTSLDYGLTSPIVSNDIMPVVIHATGSSKSILGTPITRKQPTNLVPITPLLEISSENNTASLSIDERRFESLVDSNAPSYGSVDGSYDMSGSLLYSSPSLR